MFCTMLWRVKLKFVDREAELGVLDEAARRGGLLGVFGRRRVGKTRLLRQWLDKCGGMFSQALEGPVAMQVGQVFADIRDQLATRLEPRGWEDLLEILGLQKRPWVLCLDEFPYLTAKDASLPSRLPRWLDHGMPDGCLLVLSGSSMRRMHDLFLHRAAPLLIQAHALPHPGPGHPLLVQRLFPAPQPVADLSVRQEDCSSTPMRPPCLRIGAAVSSLAPAAIGKNPSGSIWSARIRARPPACWSARSNGSG